ncbi:hypothetical protein ACKGJY_15115 [Hyunsoonleella sp. 2307UL5-6]|uniref:hypothetical protein n=1 Tax=Hyunsoonleella sp. 2307UL5-6 TaxID=3384768 RepID=UPI0039BCC925
MKLKTDYLGYDCTIFIYNGMVSKILCDLENKPKGSFLSQPEGYLLMQPKDKAELKYYKLPQEKIKEKYKYNYELEYENQGGNISTINIRLSKYELMLLIFQKIIFWFKKLDNWGKALIAIIGALIIAFLKHLLFPT